MDPHPAQAINWASPKYDIGILHNYLKFGLSYVGEVPEGRRGSVRLAFKLVWLYAYTA